MAFDIQVKIKRLDQELPLPRYANPGDAAAWLPRRACPS